MHDDILFISLVHFFACWVFLPFTSEEWHFQNGIEYWLDWTTQCEQSSKICPAFSVTFSMNGRPAQGRVEVGQTFVDFIMTEVSVVSTVTSLALFLLEYVAWTVGWHRVAARQVNWIWTQIKRLYVKDDQRKQDAH